MKRQIGLPLLICGILLLAALCTCQCHPRIGRSRIVTSEWFEMLKDGGAKQLPNGWLDTGEKNLKSEGSPGDEWLYIDHAKTGSADMRVHYYPKWNFQWLYFPEKYEQEDYEILLNGKWIPVKTSGRDNKVGAHEFTAGKWQ